MKTYLEYYVVCDKTDEFFDNQEEAEKYAEDIADEYNETVRVYEQVREKGGLLLEEYVVCTCYAGDGNKLSLKQQ